MVGMREINEYILLSTDVDPQEEDAEKSIGVVHSPLFFTAVYYNPL